MNKLVPLGLLAVGIVLIIVGIHSTNSFGSDVSRFFTGSPTDKSIWLLIGGSVAAVVSLTMTVRGSKQT